MTPPPSLEAWRALAPSPQEVRRVLLIRWSAMGDVALASAGFESVCRAFPDASIDLNTLPPWDRLFEGDPRFRELLSFGLRSGGRWRQLLAGFAWLRAVRARNYDLIIDLQSTDRSRILLACLWLIRAQVRFRVGNKRVLPYNLAPRFAPEPLHALHRINRALMVSGIKPAVDRPHLHVEEAHRTAARRKLESLGINGGDYAVFFPGSQSAGYLKRWGAGHYARLAELLAEHGVRNVLVLGGADELDECDAIARESRARIHNLCGQTSLQELVPMSAGARLIVANDTGTAHVASAANRPMLVLCGPTDPRKVLPAGPKVRSMQADLPCINCYRKHCAHHSCMALMTPARVIEAMLEDPAFAGCLAPVAQTGGF